MKSCNEILLFPLSYFDLRWGPKNGLNARSPFYGVLAVLSAKGLNNWALKIVVVKVKFWEWKLRLSLTSFQNAIFLFLRQVFFLQNKHKNLDPSYKMGLDFGIVLEGKHHLRAAFVQLGPVVQSIVSLTSSLRGQFIKCFTTL